MQIHRYEMNQGFSAQSLLQHKSCHFNYGCFQLITNICHFDSVITITVGQGAWLCYREKKHCCFSYVLSARKQYID